MHKGAFVLLGLFLCLRVHAQAQGYTAVKDMDAFRLRIEKESSRLQSLRAEFIQEKKLALLAEKIRSTGKFMFARPDNVRMEYEKPSAYLMIINGDRVYVKDGDRENVVNARNNRIFRQVNQIMLQAMKGQVLNNPDFRTAVLEGSSQYLLEMTPQSASLRGLLDKVRIYLDKKELMVYSIELWEPGGDNTVISFTKREVNAQIPDALFHFR